MKKKTRQHEFEIRRALATGYALALIEHGLFEAQSNAVGADEEHIAPLEFADWFAARGDWSLRRAYRHWRAHRGELVPEVSIPPQTPRTADTPDSTERLAR